MRDDVVKVKDNSGLSPKGLPPEPANEEPNSKFPNIKTDRIKTMKKYVIRILPNPGQ